MTTSIATNQTILVVGGGIGGMTVALESAECGDIYQFEINKKKGTELAMPLVYYLPLMTVAYGGGMKDAGLDGQVIPASGLEKIIERN